MCKIYFSLLMGRMHLGIVFDNHFVKPGSMGLFNLLAFALPAGLRPSAGASGKAEPPCCGHGPVSTCGAEAGSVVSTISPAFNLR